MTIEIALVGALDQRSTIGRDNRLLWRLPEDMKHFRAITRNNPLIMGRMTYESIGRALPGRRNIVLTRNPEFAAEGVETAGSPEEALALAAGAHRVCVIGGADVYAAFLPHADAMYLTRIWHTWDGDATFPAWNESEWKIVWEEPGTMNIRNPYLYTFYEYRKRVAGA